MSHLDKNWVDSAVNLARHIPDRRVQLGVCIYDIVSEHRSR